MRVAAVIPARMQSQRLPGKPLRRIAGVPMILRVVDRLRPCAELDRIIVATDSPEIRELVAASGAEVWMTSPRHPSGSDRVAEVAAELPHEFILNVQADEPLIPLSTVQGLVRFALNRPGIEVVTARLPIRHGGEIADPNVVKVVADREGRALYFSRCAIPYHRQAWTEAAAAACAGYFKHVGVYLYRREVLLDFTRWAASPLESAECLEQLRLLEHGCRIDVIEVEEDSRSVDTEEDLREVERLILQGAAGAGPVSGGSAVPGGV